jgi:hypothetical protein
LLWSFVACVSTHVLLVSVFTSVYGASASAVSVARRALILLMQAVREAEKPSSEVTIPASAPVSGGALASVEPPPELLPLEDELPLELPLLPPLPEPLVDEPLPDEPPLDPPLPLPDDDEPLLEPLDASDPEDEPPLSSHGSGPLAELHATSAPERATTVARTTTLGDTLRMATPPLARPRASYLMDGAISGVTPAETPRNRARRSTGAQRAAVLDGILRWDCTKTSGRPIRPAGSRRRRSDRWGTSPRMARRSRRARR